MLLIQLPPRDGVPQQVIPVPPGKTLTFGRGSSSRPVDVTIDHAGVSRLAGTITATADHWLISNMSRDRTYVVDNPQGGGEHIKLAPRRQAAPIPFEFARVLIPVDDGMVSFLVYAPEHVYTDPEPQDGDLTTAAFSLDETAKYFLILVALCEPRLRDSTSVAIPLIPDVIERLRPLESCRDLTRTAVNFHIDYLAERKLRIRDRSPGAAEERLDWRREALVTLALRFNLVTEEHLTHLPPRRSTVGG